MLQGIGKGQLLVFYNDLSKMLSSSSIKRRRKAGEEQRALSPSVWRICSEIIGHKKAQRHLS